MCSPDSSLSTLSISSLASSLPGFITLSDSTQSDLLPGLITLSDSDSDADSTSHSDILGPVMSSHKTPNATVEQSAPTKVPVLTTGDITPAVMCQYENACNNFSFIRRSLAMIKLL